jgi:hypothetical protein
LSPTGSAPTLRQGSTPHLGLRKRRPDLSFDADLGDAPDPDWAEEIDQVPVRGNLLTTEVVFFHRKSRTVLFADLIQHLDPGSLTGWRALVARLDLMTAPSPKCPASSARPLWLAGRPGPRSGTSSRGRPRGW